MPSSYSKFKYKDLENLGLKCRLNNLFHNIDIPHFEPSELFKLRLEKRSSKKLATEKSKSENITVPILDELETINQKIIAVYSGYLFDVDKTKGLRGECDFILAKDIRSYDVNYPIIQIVEAKKHDIEDLGVPQCAAQLIGARFFNQKNGIELKKIYGCATTGKIWQFLVLEGNTIYVDEKQYYIGNLPELLGAFQFIIDYYKRELV